MLNLLVCATISGLCHVVNGTQGSVILAGTLPTEVHPQDPAPRSFQDRKIVWVPCGRVGREAFRSLRLVKLSKEPKNEF